MAPKYLPTVKPRFTGSLGGRKKAQLIEGHRISGYSLHGFTREVCFLGKYSRPGISRDSVNRGFTVQWNLIIVFKVLPVLKQWLEPKFLDELKRKGN